MPRHAPPLFVLLAAGLASCSSDGSDGARDSAPKDGAAAADLGSRGDGGGPEDDVGVPADASTQADAAIGGRDAGSMADVGAPGPAERITVQFNAADGLALHGILATAGASPEGAPGILLIHQFNQDLLQWDALPERLAEAGYRTLAIDLRGHGTSDPYSAPLSDLLNDPNGAPRDVDAALAYLRGDGGADPARLAVIGTSIGANLAVASAIASKASSYVAISARKSPSENLAGLPAAGMRSVLYLAAENDSGGQAADSQAMYDATTEPRGLVVYPGTSAHGIGLLRAEPDVETQLLDWLAETL